MTKLADVILRDITANRPAAGTAGRLFFDTTLVKMQRDNGSTWDDVAESSGGSGPAELGYTTGSNFSSSSTSLVDVTGLSLTVTVGSRPILLEFYCYAVTVTGQLIVLVEFIDVTGSATVQAGEISIASSSYGQQLLMRARLNPAAGSRTYKVQAKVNGFSGTFTLNGGTGNPMEFQIREV